MSAVINIYRWTGAGPTSTDITSANTRCNAADSPSDGTTNPIVIPGAGTNYSFWVVTRLHCSTAPSTNVNNLNWYTSGSDPFGTGVGMIVAQGTAYTQATGTTGTTGNQLTTGNYTSLTGSPSNAFAYTSGSPLSVTGSTASTGDFGNYVVFQITVGTTASAGVVAQATITWSYDEY